MNYLFWYACRVHTDRHRFDVDDFVTSVMTRSISISWLEGVHCTHIEIDKKSKRQQSQMKFVFNAYRFVLVPWIMIIKYCATICHKRISTLGHFISSFLFIPHEYQHTYVEENRFVLSLALGDRSISLALIHHAVRVGFRELAIDKVGKYHILIGKFIRCVPEREINQIWYETSRTRKIFQKVWITNWHAIDKNKVCSIWRIQSMPVQLNFRMIMGEKQSTWTALIKMSFKVHRDFFFAFYLSFSSWVETESFIYSTWASSIWARV